MPSDDRPRRKVKVYYLPSIRMIYRGGRDHPDFGSPKRPREPPHWKEIEERHGLQRAE